MKRAQSAQQFETVHSSQTDIDHDQIERFLEQRGEARIDPRAARPGSDPPAAAAVDSGQPRRRRRIAAALLPYSAIDSSTRSRSRSSPWRTDSSPSLALARRPPTKRFTSATVVSRSLMKRISLPRSTRAVVYYVRRSAQGQTETIL